MSQAVSFTNITPAARFDSTPWTEARIAHADTSAGPFTEFDVIVFDVPDADPENPQARNLTAIDPSDDLGLWYTITFADAPAPGGSTGRPFRPIRNGSSLALSGRDLCTLEDVTSYVPAYRPNDTTDAKLCDLITSESDLIHVETGREIIAAADQPETRSFRIEKTAAWVERLDIGDLASAGDTDITVEVLSAAGEVVTTLERATFRPLYGRTLRRNQREAWEPITGLELPRALGAPSLSGGQTLLVTGNWGYPAIPEFIRQACAKRVILRYVTEVAGSGDAFSEAANALNLAGLFASARDAVAQISPQGPMIA